MLGKVEQLLKINQRDNLMKTNVINLYAYLEELKANKEKYKYLCLNCLSPINK